MADHVAVGVVNCDKAVGIILKSLQKLVCNRVRVHLGMGGERRGIEAARDIDLIFALGRRRGLAVKEARDMAELLRLGDAELLKPCLGDNLAEEVVHAAARTARAEKIIFKLIPVAREAEERNIRTTSARTGVIIAYERLSKLNGAILTVVGVHHDVTVLHAGVVADDVAGNVLVGHGSVIGGLARLVLVLDGLFNRINALADAVYDAGVGRIGKSVLLRAVHTVIAAHSRSDNGVAYRSELLFKAGDILKC